MMTDGSVRRARGPWRRGFTLVEMLIAVTIIGLVLAIGASGLRQYHERIVVREAAAVVAVDIAVTRSAAIKLRRNVSLVAREDSLAYVIRSDSGVVLRPVRTFNTGSELPLTKFDVKLTGDSLTFNSRGILVSSGTREIDVARSNRAMQVQFNALGRTRIVSNDG